MFNGIKENLYDVKDTVNYKKCAFRLRFNFMYNNAKHLNLQEQDLT